jgi:hypothetical protein
MSVIDRVKSHFETLKTITIEVEEWKDEHGNPSVFYSEPLTLEEKNLILKLLKLSLLKLRSGKTSMGILVSFILSH